jgi:hypothetical protein
MSKLFNTQLIVENLIICGNNTTQNLNIFFMIFEPLTYIKKINYVR